MKKIMGILVAAGVMLAMLPVAVTATSPKWLPEEDGYKGCYPASEVARQRVCEKTMNVTEIQNRKQIRNRLLEQQRTHNRTGVRFRGIWGFTGDNESDGYFAGVVTKGRHVARLHGVWNTSDNGSKGRIIGVMRHGYFNGRVVTGNGSVEPIAGLYRVNKEKHVLRMRWMTPDRAGWAVARIGLSQ
ncbi:MAG TPA: hypothetical protein ENI42_00125 [Thermoplasmatales archaeon]|nr:hypothetical protein [Thermoplasmatales archaeon]